MTVEHIDFFKFETCTEVHCVYWRNNPILRTTIHSAMNWKVAGIVIAAGAKIIDELN